MPQTRPYRQPFGGFPDRDDHDQRWQSLAKAIAANGGQVSDDPAVIRPAAKPGELTVIGSGIEAAGFTSADEMRIRDADEVFFCVADPATVVWIKALRPDAYDLYVLYDDGKPRYLTYMQMAEAMLHFVRMGRRVLAIYYGHPGVFVLSTHRAIAIARREGHRAVMRAAVSALDTLCADLGIDPSQPGLQTFEATDMLIRRRRVDTCVHLVLWQVGLIGELGYRRKGFLNSGFSLLLDYLEEAYGPGHTVVNYVGSRYPGIDPVIDVRTIAAFRDPDAQAAVTGISTFYLPPMAAAPVDPDTLRKLGLLRPGGVVTAPSRPLREIERYGPRELRAFGDFAGFRVPTGYHWQQDTPGARFVLALRDDRALRDWYAVDPAGAVADWGGAALDSRERALMGRREAGPLQIAAKGLPAADERVRLLATTLLSSTAAARGLLRAVRAAEPEAREKAVTQWAGTRLEDGAQPEASAQLEADAAEIGRPARVRPVGRPELERELDWMLGQMLYPWTGMYLAPDPMLSLFVLGGTGLDGVGRIFLDGRPVLGARYVNGTMRWRATSGNPANGQLRTDVSPRGARRLIGVIWPPRVAPGTRHQVAALEHVLPRGVSLSGPAGTEPGESPFLGLPGWACPHLDAILASANQRRPDVGALQYLRSWQRAAGNLRTVRAALCEARP